MESLHQHAAVPRFHVDVTQRPHSQATAGIECVQEALAIANTRETVQGGGVKDGYGGETDPSTGI